MARDVTRPSIGRYAALVVLAAAMGALGRYLLFVLPVFEPMLGGYGVWAVGSALTWLLLGAQVANASTLRIIVVGALSTVLGALLQLLTFLVYSQEILGQNLDLTPKSLLVFPIAGPLMTAPISVPVGVAMSFLANSVMSVRDPS